VDNYFITNWLQPNSAGRTFPHADPFLGKQYQIAVSDLAGSIFHKAVATTTAQEVIFSQDYRHAGPPLGQCAENFLTQRPL
jgi:hypothetical protein